MARDLLGDAAQDLPQVEPMDRRLGITRNLAQQTQGVLVIDACFQPGHGSPDRIERQALFPQFDDRARRGSGRRPQRASRREVAAAPQAQHPWQS
jgi:hypothetical protein